MRSEKTLYFCEIFHGRAPRSRRKRSRRFDPPWGPKADHAPGLSPSKVQKPTAPRDFCTAKCESRQRPWTLLRRSAKADQPARSFARRSAKADQGAGLFYGEAQKPTPAAAFARARAFGRATGPGGGENGSLPYTARKSQFLRNGDVWATESLFLFAVLWLAFLPDQSETGVAGGGKARRPETPAAPRRPRPTTATGSRFLRRQRKRPPRRPRPSPPAREGSLGAPNDRTFPPGAERKARKEKGKEEPRMKRAPPL